jgi:ubiquinone/menaquinone biosynthesis C-methylase UbiE
MSAIPYAEYQKLSLWWLGFSPRELDKETIGGRRTRVDTPLNFLHDIHQVICEMKRILKPQKYCCIIIGNPIYAGKKWHLNEIVKKEAASIGFYPLKEIVKKKHRLTMGKMREEYILILKNE